MCNIIGRCYCRKSLGLRQDGEYETRKKCSGLKDERSGQAGWPGIIFSTESPVWDSHLASKVTQWVKMMECWQPEPDGRVGIGGQKSEELSGG